MEGAIGGGSLLFGKATSVGRANESGNGRLAKLAGGCRCQGDRPRVRFRRIKVMRQRVASSLALAVFAAGAASNAFGRATTPQLAGATSRLHAVIVRANDGSNGRTIAIRRGQRLRVVLSSTYWQLQPSSNTTVLGLIGRPTISPQLTGCVPGEGCGTATATYLASRDGKATVTATRTSCGEALRCTGAGGLFTLHVLVR